MLPVAYQIGTENFRDLNVKVVKNMLKLGAGLAYIREIESLFEAIEDLALAEFFRVPASQGLKLLFVESPALGHGFEFRFESLE